MHEEIYVHLTPLPGKITEAVTACAGGYNIAIDPRQSQDGIIRSYNHAMEHIKGNDFKKSDADMIEENAHKK